MWPDVIRVAGELATAALAGAWLAVVAYGRRQRRSEFTEHDLARRVETLERVSLDHDRDINGIGGKAAGVQTELRVFKATTRLKIDTLAQRAGVAFGADSSYPPDSR